MTSGTENLKRDATKAFATAAQLKSHAEEVTRQAVQVASEAKAAYDLSTKVMETINTLEFPAPNAPIKPLEERYKDVPVQFNIITAKFKTEAGYAEDAVEPIEIGIAKQLNLREGVVNVRKKAVDETLGRIFNGLTNRDATINTPDGSVNNLTWNHTRVAFVVDSETGKEAHRDLMTRHSGKKHKIEVQERAEKYAKIGGILDDSVTNTRGLPLGSYVWVEKTGERSKEEYENKDDAPQTKYNYVVYVAFTIEDVYTHFRQLGANVG